MFKGNLILNCIILLHCIRCQCNDVQRYFTDLNACVTFYEETMLSRNFNSMEHCNRLLEEHSRILSRMLDHLRHSQDNQITSMLSELHDSLSEMLLQLEIILHPQLTPAIRISVCRTGGRPRYDLTREQLTQLRNIYIFSFLFFLPFKGAGNDVAFSSVIDTVTIDMCEDQPDAVILLNDSDPSVASSSITMIPASSVMMMSNDDAPQASGSQLDEGSSRSLMDNNREWQYAALFESDVSDSESIHFSHEIEDIVSTSSEERDITRILENLAERIDDSRASYFNISRKHIWENARLTLSMKVKRTWTRSGHDLPPGLSQREGK